VAFLGIFNGMGDVLNNNKVSEVDDLKKLQNGLKKIQIWHNNDKSCP
jgi:hypothetical protein